MRSLLLVALVAAASASAQQPGAKAPTAADAEKWLSRAEHQLDSLAIRASRAAWVQQNFITDDTEILNAEASRDFAVAVQKFATDSRKYEKAPLSPALKRKFLLLKLSLSAPPPADSKKATEFSTLAAGLDAEYGKGTWRRKSKADASKQECLQ